jgi:TatD DNase family protein
MIVDTHCHLDYIARQDDHPDGAAGSDAAQVMARAAEAGVQWIVNPGVTPARFPDVLAMAERFENVYAALAVHPTDVADIEDDPDWLASLTALLDHPLYHRKIVALGETGLDYYHDTTHTALQQRCFRSFLALGRERDLPVIIHDREAHADVLAIASEFPGVRGVMHCFSGDAAFARQMTALGFYVSFAGNLTFKNAANLHEAARETPLERILIETDSPFLSPVPFRGKPNEPARVRFVAEKIAELKGIPYADVAAVTTANARAVFGV